ncbi:hypothetical protein FB45DRAFT_1105685 [Roridomyces roridus]|uniref:F-box domain-containing protein n=1 Tax=Roridomyces roridus TaxID=1738132 RepID=A0AAD7FCW2_9AGAR|nr:hypothetical protein FB45DRAFT_1105685 [Roridomyces roridus]
MFKHLPLLFAFAISAMLAGTSVHLRAPTLRDRILQPRAALPARPCPALSFAGALTVTPTASSSPRLVINAHSSSAFDEGSDRREENMTLTITIRRTARACDWDRFTFYARRVRSFKDAHVRRDISVVYDILASKFPNGAVFPRLETLDWFPIDSGLFHRVRVFLSPRLTRLHISLRWSGDFGIFDTLSAKCLALKNLHIGDGDSSMEIYPFICALQHLETLVVRCLDVKAFEHLSRLPRFRYLSIMFDTPGLLSSRSKDSPWFPALRALRCEFIDAAPNLLEQTGRSLVQLCVSSPSCQWPPTTPTKRHIQELYAALASHCTHMLLETLNVTKDRSCRAQLIDPAQLDLYVVSGDDLRKLFCLRNLVHVSLEHTIVDLDDAVALEMAQAWPCIELLAFPCDSLHRITLRMTLEGVSAFAEHCPLVRHLFILFDATSVPKSKLASGKKQCRASQNKLTSLDVAYSLIGTKKKEWQRVAEFLRLIFPALDHVEAMKPDSSASGHVLAMHRSWMKVSDAIR